jgi:hypothetical protein
MPGGLRYTWLASGSSSAVERGLPKPDVAGSIPVSRSILPFSGGYFSSSGLKSRAQELMQ